MTHLFVDGDYLLTGMLPTSEDVVRGAVEHMYSAMERQLFSGTAPVVELRVAFFSSNTLKSLEEEQRELLVSSLRRLRFQTTVLDSISGRSGSPVDAAMCTRTMAVISKLHAAGGGKRTVFIYFTPNAYITPALESAHGANCETCFLTYNGDNVADILLAYVSGNGTATVSRGKGVSIAPNTESVQTTLSVLHLLESRGVDIPLAVLMHLKAMQQQQHPHPPPPPPPGKGGQSIQTTTTTTTMATPPITFIRHSPTEANPMPSATAPLDEDNDDFGASDAAGVPETITIHRPHTEASTNGVTATREDSHTDRTETHLTSTAKTPMAVAMHSAPPVSMPPASTNPRVEKAPDGFPEPEVSTRLPVGWALLYDRERRRHYFVHTETGRPSQTSWTHPCGEAEQMELERQVEAWYGRQQAKREGVKREETTTASTDWVECVDAKSGRKYYTNRQTKQTSWTLPAGVDAVKLTDPLQVQGQEKPQPTSINLPPHWEEQVDPRTGKRFYVNHQTQETTWIQPQQVSAPVTPPAPSIGNLPPNWEERVDPGTGKKFYVNHQTRETTWIRPQAVSPPVQQIQPPLQAPGNTQAHLSQTISSNLPPNWEERVDPGTGKKFYVNHQTRETTWIRPQAVSPPVQQIQPPLQAPGNTQAHLSQTISSNLPPNWEERVDPRTGKKFYVNHQTRETTWVPPSL